MRVLEVVDRISEKARERSDRFALSTPGGFVLIVSKDTMAPGEVTILLERWRGGDRSALEDMTPLVYDELRSVAGAYLRRELANPGLQVTELVGQLFVELLELQGVQVSDRRHFFVFAARIMRHILTDQARTTKAAKRGAELEHLPLNAELAWVGPSSEAATLDLEAALGELEVLDAGKVRALELRYFFGFTAEETAQALDVSKSTVDRDVRFALVWLNARLHPRKTG